MGLPQSMGTLEEVYQTKAHFLRGFGCGGLGFLYGPGLSSISPDRAISPASHSGESGWPTRKNRVEWTPLSGSEKC